ncbi:PaaI family thioesterase [soil metagenome]
MTDAADMAQALNDSMDGWNKAMGVRFVRATADEVVAELDIGPVHRQPYGIVHGGVHAGIIELTTSTGAALSALKDGRSVVGLENNTSFLKAVREGTLRVTALPLARGRSTQVWEARVTDDAGRLVATGRVRLFVLDPGAALAGAAVPTAPG